jgi:hypothetical protein
MNETEDTRTLFWEKTAKTAQAEAIYYREQLAKSHELLGRIVHQISERWDSVRLTQYYPTDNHFGKSIYK